MSTIITVFTFCIPFIAIFAAIYVALRSMRKTGNAKKAFGRHLLTLVVVFIACIGFSVFASAETADTAGTTNTAVDGNANAAAVAAEGQMGLALIGAGLSVGLAGIGGGIALAGGAPAAIGATSEDPKAFGKAMIFVALGEAIALYGFLIAFLILIKIPNFPALPASI